MSSIHVNGWFGGYDKLTTSLRMLFDEFGINATANREAIVFAGDSPNDAPMFEYFPNSVGVANVMHFKNSRQRHRRGSRQNLGDKVLQNLQAYC